MRLWLIRRCVLCGRVGWRGFERLERRSACVDRGLCAGRRTARAPVAIRDERGRVVEIHDGEMRVYAAAFKSDHDVSGAS